jgi:hypothetical protein
MIGREVGRTDAGNPSSKFWSPTGKARLCAYLYGPFFMTYHLSGTHVRTRGASRAG